MKKFLKSFVVAVACFALIGLGYTATTVNAAVPFTDVKNDTAGWYYDVVDELYNAGIAFGYNNSKTEFKPDQAANRGETAQFIANALGLDLKNVKDPGFTDVPKNHPYYAAIAALANEGIVGGVGDNKFNPGGQLQRVHFSKILILAFDLEESKVTSSSFADVNRYAQLSGQTIWIPYVQTLVDYKITTGVTPTEFQPEGAVTRAQLATFLKRGIDATDSGDFEVISVE